MLPYARTCACVCEHRRRIRAFQCRENGARACAPIRLRRRSERERERERKRHTSHIRERERKTERCSRRLYVNRVYNTEHRTAGYPGESHEGALSVREKEKTVADPSRTRSLEQVIVRARFVATHERRENAARTETRTLIRVPVADPSSAERGDPRTHADPAHACVR